MNKHAVTFTLIQIEDKESGGYTGYFAEIPEAIAQGESIDELMANIFAAIATIFDFRKCIFTKPSVL